MKRFASHYPISKIICDTFNNSNLRPGQFVSTIGYRNINNGVEKLDQWVKQGEGSDFFLQRIKEVFEIPEVEIEQALVGTKAIKDREAAECILQKESASHY